MTTDRSTVEMMIPSDRLRDLDFESRIKAIRKLILTLKTLIIIRKPESMQVTSPAATNALEELVLMYLSSGHLRRPDVQELLQALILVTRCHPKPIYPVSYEAKDDSGIEGLMETMEEEEKEISLELMDFFQRIVTDGLISVEYAAAYTSDALVNYKTSKKRFQRQQLHVQALLQAGNS